MHLEWTGNAQTYFNLRDKLWNELKGASIWQLKTKEKDFLQLVGMGYLFVHKHTHAYTRRVRLAFLIKTHMRAEIVSDQVRKRLRIGKGLCYFGLGSELSIISSILGSELNYQIWVISVGELFPGRLQFPPFSFGFKKQCQCTCLGPCLK